MQFIFGRSLLHKIYGRRKKRKKKCSTKSSSLIKIIINNTHLRNNHREIVQNE